MQALSQAKPGGTYTIHWMFGVPDVLELSAQPTCGGGRYNPRNPK